MLLTLQTTTGGGEVMTADETGRAGQQASRLAALKSHNATSTAAPAGPGPGPAVQRPAAQTTRTNVNVHQLGFSMLRH